MTDTVASLRATLAERLGLDTLSTAETARLEEIVNASTALVLGDGVQALADTYIGSVPGDITVTISAHTAGSAAITLTSSPAQVRQGDLVVDDNGDNYLVKSISGAVLDIGVPAPAALTGNLTITRRTIALPHAGVVEAVYRESQARPLKQARWGGEIKKGAATHFDQVFDAGASHIILFPAPNATDRYTIRQYRAVAKDTTLDVPNGVIERILATAIVNYVAWTSGDFSAVERQRRDSIDLSGEGSGTGVIVR